MAQLHDLLLRRRKPRDHAADGGAQFPFHQALVRGGGVHGLGRFRETGGTAAHQLAAQVVVPHAGGDAEHVAAQVAVARRVEPRRRHHQARRHLLQQLRGQRVIPAARAEEVAQRRRVLGEQEVGREGGAHGL